MRRAAWRGRTSSVVIGATLVLAACGDSADDGAGSTAPTPTTSTAADAAAGDVETYCEKSLEIETAPEPDVDFRSASEEEIAAAIKQAATETYLPLAQEIQAVAPEDVRADIDTLVAAVEQVAATGDFEGAFETPEVSAAEERLHAFDLDACGWEPVDVTAIDYAFQGVERTYEPGPVSFEFTNKGSELHELALFKKNEGVSESFADIFGGEQAEAMEKVTSLGGTFAEPGAADYDVANLEAGDYALVCFIPVGTTPEAVTAAEESGEEPEGGPPHFTQGMLAEFTVE